MDDQLVFDGSLSLVGIDTGLVTLTGTVDASYGATNTATGSLSVTAAGAVQAQTYTDLTLTETSPGNYTLTGTNSLSTVTVTYSGETPTSSSASISTVLGWAACHGHGECYIDSDMFCRRHAHPHRSW